MSYTRKKKIHKKTYHSKKKRSYKKKTRGHKKKTKKYNMKGGENPYAKLTNCYRCVDASSGTNKWSNATGCGRIKGSCPGWSGTPVWNSLAAQAPTAKNKAKTVQKTNPNNTQYKHMIAFGKLMGFNKA